MIKVLFLLIYGLLICFAPALFFKAIFTKHFSFTSYCVALIMICAEIIYLIGAYEVGEPPSLFSKLPGALIYLILTILITKLIASILKFTSSWSSILFGSTLGTLGVFFVSCLYDKDMSPLYPISNTNPLFGAIPGFLIDIILNFALGISLCIFAFRLIKKIPMCAQTSQASAIF